MKPTIQYIDNASHTRYALGRQIYTAEVYPFSAPDGSKIVVCGHDQGLLLIWKVGLSSKRREDDLLRRQDPEQDVHMSGGEGFEAEDETNGSITQQLDLSLGTAVLHVSFPPLKQTTKPQQTPLAPKFLQQDLVVAFACDDGSIRLLTIPLEPPSPTILASKKLQQHPLAGQAGEGAWAEQLVTIPHAHQNMPRGVSIAFAPRTRLDLMREDNDDDDDNSVDVLLTSHSADLSGTLLVHRIPVEHGKNRFGTPYIWRCRPLSSPACSVDLVVSSSGEPSPKILVGESSGNVRIFDCISPKHHAGNWSLSLFAPVTKVSDNHTASLRSARWVLGGSAIAVLTADGGWGVWDISDSKTGRSISGARPTPFTISGRVGTIAGGISAPKTSNEKAEVRSQLAPMTPGTRKIRQDNLFHGKADFSTKRGGIGITHYTNSIASGEIDESLVFWYADSVVYLPSLRTHWQNKFRGSSTVFTTSAQGHIRDVPSISLGGECRVSVSAFLTENHNGPSKSTDLHILVAGERSLSFSSPQTTSRITSSNLTSANQSRVSDQSLLSRGMLDVNGLDRVLDGLQTERSGSALGSSTLGQRKVLFQ